MIPRAVVQAAIGGADQIYADAQYGCEGRHRIEAAVEAEDEFIEVGRQMCAPSMGANLWGESPLWENRIGLIESNLNH
jgi:hypothetical protein